MNRTQTNGTRGWLVALLVLMALAGASRSAQAGPVCEAVVPAGAGDMKITAGRDEGRVWLTADRGPLRVRKFTAKDGESILELGARNDTVIIQLARGGVRVTRNGASITIDSPDALDRLQELLGGSAAMYHARMALSDHEGRSALKAPEMSLLSALAFAASLTGDAGAPLRLADRFMLKHRGVLRQVAFFDEASCWSDYQSEVDAAWDDLEACMEEAGDGVMGSLRRLACNGTWVLRSESAWFEYLNCINPLGVVDKLE